METLKAGTLAYIDTFIGMVPCKVISITQNRLSKDNPQSSKITWCKVRVTANCPGYKEGEVIEQMVGGFCPRKSVTGQYKNRIAAHNIEVDKEA